MSLSTITNTFTARGMYGIPLTTALYTTMTLALNMIRAVSAQGAYPIESVPKNDENNNLFESLAFWKEKKFELMGPEDLLRDATSSGFQLKELQ